MEKVKILSIVSDTLLRGVLWALLLAPIVLSTKAFQAAYPIERDLCIKIIKSMILYNVYVVAVIISTKYGEKIDREGKNKRM